MTTLYLLVEIEPAYISYSFVVKKEFRLENSCNAGCICMNSERASEQEKSLWEMSGVPGDG